MAYTQQLINKEDHLLACTTRMFETHLLLGRISNCVPSPDQLAIKTTWMLELHREKHSNSHPRGVRLFTFQRASQKVRSFHTFNLCPDNDFRQFRNLFPQTFRRSGRGDNTGTFLRVKLCFLFCLDLINRLLGSTRRCFQTDSKRRRLHIRDNSRFRSSYLDKRGCLTLGVGVVSNHILLEVIRYIDSPTPGSELTRSSIGRGLAGRQGVVRKKSCECRVQNECSCFPVFILRPALITLH
jgi:hypothetical protein